MKINELASELRKAVAAAPDGKKVVTIHLFGIEHAKSLVGVDAARLAEPAGESRTYGTELKKGANLAAFVTIRGKP
jgi:hypothetical protein